MDWTEILVAIITGVLGIVASVGIPLLCYYLHKKNKDTEDENVRAYVDELIDDAGQLITDVVDSIIETTGVQTLSLTTKEGKDTYEQATVEINELLNDESKEAIKKRTNDHYKKYIEVKIKKALYDASQKETDASTDA